MRTLKRIGLGCLLTASLGSLGSSIYPRVYAFNQASQGALIASTRAANCRVLKSNLIPNETPVDELGKPFPAGTTFCDRNGLTGQATDKGAIGYPKQGDTAAIIKILETRGFKF